MNNHALSGSSTLLLCFLSPDQHQGPAAVDYVARPDEQLLHASPGEARLRAHGNLELHRLEDDEGLVGVEHVALVDEHLPHVCVERRFDGGDAIGLYRSR